ncbi:MAG: hypothetical protein ABEJ65_10515 [bacterium]
MSGFIGFLKKSVLPVLFLLTIGIGLYGIVQLDVPGGKDSFLTYFTHQSNYISLVGPGVHYMVLIAGLTLAGIAYYIWSTFGELDWVRVLFRSSSFVFAIASVIMAFLGIKAEMWEPLALFGAFTTLGIFAIVLSYPAHDH